MNRGGSGPNLRRMSTANLAVILLMIVVFALAILLPFPRGAEDEG